MALNPEVRAAGSVDDGGYVISTPQPERTRCDFCTGPSVYSRRDTAGNTYRACVQHATDMEVLVREINEWDSVKESLP